MSVFVLELGMEELPARFLDGLERELTDKFTEALAAAGLRHGALAAASTPRRVALWVQNLAAKAEESEKVVQGPPLRVALDASGGPSKAGEGFARSQGIAFAQTFSLRTDKGEYLAARVRSGGEEAGGLLARICPEIVAGLGFPKRMRWGNGDFTFARPLRWVLALLDAQVLPFSVGGLEAGRLTRGHRVHGPGPFALAEAAEYFGLLEGKGGLILKGGERARLIQEQGERLAEEAGGRVIWKQELLAEVRGLCERPVPLLGGFDPAFLEMPREVLLTSMEHHQKSFGLEDAAGRLLPHFLTVLNMSPRDVGLVRRGWERVLRARLEDARFFWQADLREDFELWLASLDKVIFLAGLGSMADKARRVSRLAAWIAEKTGASELREQAARAGLLSKADLVTRMVGEFDTLQGIMGSIYAARRGETAELAQALAEQYLPAGPDSPLPASPIGAIVSMADKADTLAGCFGLGLMPTGAADPYALRRAALGIARITLERGPRLEISELLAQALAGYGERQWSAPPQEIAARLNDFFCQRLKNYFTGRGAETLLTEAVLAADWSDARAAAARLEALRRFSREADFAEAVLTFKRPANILRRQEEPLDGLFERALLQERAELELARALEETRPLFTQARPAGDKADFDALFAVLRNLKPLVDAFFNEVMVMCEDAALRRNRLNLLRALVDQLRVLADFEALQA